MNFKPKTLMIASLIVVLAAMSTTTWAQKIGKKSERQQKSKQQESERPQQRRVTQIAKIGKPAPNFKLKDSTGKNHTLADYKGKIVVLQWISPVCPVCVRVSSTSVVGDMLKTIKGIDSDFVHLTIHSNDGAKIAKSSEYLKKYDIKSPALDDTSGRVGRMYGAKTTPHMFVIDKKGILRYSGAIDDDDSGSKGSDATNYVVNAIQQIVANETVAPDSTKSYGCQIKYAKGRDSKGGRDAGGRRGSRAQWLTRYDTNDDGSLDAKELEAIPEEQRNKMLENFDANKDGTIDKEEIKSLMQRRGGREGRGERGGRRGGRGGRGGDGG